jgi:hypothetical protein
LLTAAKAVTTTNMEVGLSVHLLENLACKRDDLVTVLITRGEGIDSVAVSYHWPKNGRSTLQPGESHTIYCHETHHVYV